MSGKIRVAAVLGVLGVLGVFFVSWALAADAKASIGVSPGHMTRFVRVIDVAPTFNWAAVRGAKGYNLIVYKVSKSAGGEMEMSKALEVKISGSASGWTPSAEQTLTPGDYAWAVRAIVDRGVSEWSAPLLFSVVTPEVGVPEGRQGRPSEVADESAPVADAGGAVKPVEEGAAALPGPTGGDPDLNVNGSNVLTTGKFFDCAEGEGLVVSGGQWTCGPVGPTGVVGPSGAGIVVTDAASCAVTTEARGFLTCMTPACPDTMVAIGRHVDTSAARAGCVSLVNDGPSGAALARGGNWRAVLSDTGTCAGSTIVASTICANP
jgi:hypothetical protein